VADQDRQPAVGEDVAGDPAEHELAQAGPAVAAHDQEVGAGRGRGVQERRADRFAKKKLATSRATPRMGFDEAAQGLLQLCRMGKIASLLRRHDIVDDHALDQELTVRALDEAAAQLESHRLAEVLVLGDRIDLFLAKCAERKAILERQHGHLSRGGDALDSAISGIRRGVLP
jgi:hypothetical protein